MSAIDWNGLEWKEGVAMPRERGHFNCAAVDGKIYCLSGINLPRDTVDIFDTGTGRWQTGGTPVNSQLTYGAGCVAYNQKIYCIGGRGSDSQATGRVLIYDTRTDTWSSGEGMPQRNSYFGCVVNGDKIYCVGGSITTTSYDSLLVYDIPTDSWSSGASYPFQISNMGIVSIGERIYVFGGAVDGKPSDRVFAYDIQRDQWEERASLPAPRYGGESCGVNGLGFLIGGVEEEDGVQEAVDTCLAYNAALDSWEQIPSLLQARVNHRCVFAGGAIYCLGGGTLSQGTVSTSVEYLDLGEIGGGGACCCCCCCNAKLEREVVEMECVRLRLLVCPKKRPLLDRLEALVEELRCDCCREGQGVTECE